MRAVIARAFGPPHSFSCEEVVPPLPARDQVRVTVQAAAVNFVDTLISSGRYQVKPSLPFTPGGEFAGVVDIAGGDVRDLIPGDRVCGSGLTGAFADMLTASPDNLSVIPQSMSSLEAAIFRVSNATAYHALVQRAQLKAGETVLVLGAAGGVGYAAVQVAKALGAHVIGSASSEGKRAMVSSVGADVVIDSEAHDWRDRIRACTAGHGVDVVVDPVGGDATERAFRSLARGGRHLMIGFASGKIAALPTNLALLRAAALIGVNVREFRLSEPEDAERNVLRLFALWQQGQLKPPPMSVYPFARFREALVRASERETTGRLVLDMLQR
jgi:NADPH2:quinone reductase